MGGSLRTCKEKLYGGVHEALSTWVGGAVEDGWDWGDVRQGPRIVENVSSPKKSPRKVDKAPMLEMPKLELGGGAGVEDGGGWL